MINKPHRLQFGQTGAVASGNECHAKAMAGRTACGDLQQHVKSSVVLAREGRCGAAGSGITECEQISAQRGGKWNGVKFSWIGVGSLGIRNVDDIALKVDLAHGHRRFAEAASEVEHDFEDVSHPLWAAGEFVPRALQGARSDIGLGLHGRARDFGQGDGVAVAEIATDGFVHDKGQEFDFKPRGVLLCPGLSAPVHVFGRQLVANFSGMTYAALIQKLGELTPRLVIALSAGWARVMRGNVSSDPRSETARAARFAARPFDFVAGRLLRSTPSFARCWARVVTQARRSIAPFTRLGMSGSQNPKWRFADFSEEGHAPTVPPSSTYSKWNKVVPCGLSGLDREKVCRSLNYHYTTGQYKLLVNQRFTKEFHIGSTLEAGKRFCGIAESIVGWCGFGKAKRGFAC
jgi:hypothetical protein